MNNSIDFNNGKIGEYALINANGIISIQKYNLLNQGYLFQRISTANMFLALDCRRLSPAFSTAPFSVRRNSDFSVSTTIASWIGEHVNSSAIRTWVGAGTNGLATQWNDQISNRNFAASIPGNSPFCIDVGQSVTINGRQALVGRGSFQSRLFLNTYFQTNTFTIIIVLTTGTNTQGRYFSCTGSDTNADYYSGGFTLYQQSLNQLVFSYSPGYAVVGNTSNGPHVVSITVNGSGVKLRVDGGSWNNGSLADSILVTSMSLFSNVAGNSPLNGEKISSFYIYQRVLSDGELNVIERNLGIYYGITVN